MPRKKSEPEVWISQSENDDKKLIRARENLGKAMIQGYWKLVYEIMKKWDIKDFTLFHVMPKITVEIKVKMQEGKPLP